MPSKSLVFVVATLICTLSASANYPSEPHSLNRRQISGNNDPSADCSGYELNRGTWAELGIDNYLLHYPGGLNMSLADYTRSLNVLNFDCGVGKICLAGQLCHPVRGRDWVVLSAVQEWNFYMNSLYEAVGSAMAMVQGASAAMVADFLPEGDEKKFIATLTIGLLSLSGVVLLGFTAALVIPIAWALLATAWSWIAWGAIETGGAIAAGWTWLTTLGAETAVASVETAEAAAGASTEAAGITAAAENQAATAGLKAEQASLVGAAPRLRKRGIFHKHHKTITQDKFQMWSIINSYLRKLEDRLQSIISVTSKLALFSPISSQDGLYGVLQNGTFLSEHPPKATLLDNAQETAQLGALAQLFKLMNVIFVIDSAPCKQEGPTTPLKNPELVHFCSADGVKTSLAMVTEKELDYKIRNGRLLFSKYSYSTDFLFGLASDCQASRQNQSLPAINSTLTLANQGSPMFQNMIRNGTGSSPSTPPNIFNGSATNGTQSSPPLNPNSRASTVLLPDGTAVCSFPIQICDLRQPDIKDKITSGTKPAKACSDFLHLPASFPQALAAS